MKIDFSQQILGIDGQPLPVAQEPKPKKDGEKEEKVEQKFLTLRDVAVNSLVSERVKTLTDGRQVPAETLTGTDKVQRMRLADRIYGAKEPINLTAEEIVLLKNLIDGLYGTLVTARAWEFLEGKKKGVKNEDQS